uniref:putative reverse transcriptase/maturase n=1 Tax=Chroothece richteriana TaxID=101928 RepID=UPI001FCD6301|nr:putative reverse transcriptase/maturase [Chroothece richteriana]UNJ14277.1 putative reverse transcriptase/maturase [Chroothece richteriana]
MKDRIVFWDILDWDQIRQYVFKFQRKIYSASLLKEICRTKFLQKKFLHSKLLKLWITHQVIKFQKNYITSFERHKIFLELSNIMQIKYKKENSGVIKESKIFLIYTILNPEWEAYFSIQKKHHNFSITELVRKISCIASRKYSSLYIVKISLEHQLDLIYLSKITRRLNTFSLINDSVNHILESGIIRTYKEFLTKKFFILQYDERYDIKLSLLLLEALFSDFSTIFHSYIRKRQVLEISFYSEVSCQYMRYLHNFIILDPEKSRIEDVRTLLQYWLYKIGIKKPVKRAKNLSKSLKVELNHYLIIKNNNKNTRIYPSKYAQAYLLEIISNIIKKMRNASLILFIQLISTILKRWKSYFSICKCSEIFNRLDNLIFQKIRAWVFRRHSNWSKSNVKQKYFAPIVDIKYYKRLYTGNWILSSSFESKNLDTAVFIVPKLRWHNCGIKFNTTNFSNSFHLNYLYRYGRYPNLNIL